jgi:pyrimidine operon attenuation protein / uracil phosphoribosyltransferase
MVMSKKLIFNAELLAISIDRLCYQLIESHGDFNQTVLVGLQPRGIHLARRIRERLNQLIPGSQLQCGELDVSFFRDDFRRRELIVPSATRMDFIVEEKKVVMVDDVLYTGRTIRAGFDALLAFGRPAKVELLVLINRKFSRQFPIEPDYIGKSIDTIATEKVRVHWHETDGEEADGVWLISDDDQHG